MRHGGRIWKTESLIEFGGHFSQNEIKNLRICDVTL